MITHVNQIVGTAELLLSYPLMPCAYAGKRDGELFRRDVFRYREFNLEYGEHHAFDDGD